MDFIGQVGPLCWGCFQIKSLKYGGFNTKSLNYETNVLDGTSGVGYREKSTEYKSLVEPSFETLEGEKVLDRVPSIGSRWTKGCSSNPMKWLQVEAF